MKQLHKIQGNTLVFLIIISLFMLSGCQGSKDDEGSTAIDIMQGGTEFTGNFPEVSVSVFTSGNSSYKVKCNKNQYVVFFKAKANEAAAGRIIGSAGGTILEKVPLIGYYLAETSQFQMGQGFVATLAANDSVELIMPNATGHSMSSTSVIDYCSANHGAKVIQSLKDCGGSFDYCSNAMYVDSVTQEVYAPMSKVIRNLLYNANANKSGATLINLSINGGLSDCNYADLS